jgi:hypothetical protein
MPLIKCPDCEREVSAAAPTCPGCGRLMKAPASKFLDPGANARSCLVGCAAVAVLALLGWLVHAVIVHR